MIVFDLKCTLDHRFEAWFRSSSAYEEQKAAGLVECPHCGSVDISKAPMAPNVAAKGNQKVEAVPVAASSAKSMDPKAAELAAEARKLFSRLRTHVEETCDYVGDNFAEEARKIHYGETEERGIYGESTVEETKALLDEGVEILPLPGQGRKDA
ncbi:MAG: DUF1178 family protein [Alphaproteobacteria bacterium]|nr:DUF1178 family protein [Alphaproteobacteria bacterium]